jgi:hypothetical protein
LPAWPWLTGADSTGNSLQRLGSGSFGDDPANWEAAFNTHTGRTYTVERLDVIKSTNTWTAFTNFSPSVSGTAIVSDPQTAAGHFYRLKVTRN